MKFLRLSLFAVSSLLNIQTSTAGDHPHDIAQHILTQALHDGIDLSLFNFTPIALDEIVSWSKPTNVSSSLSQPPRNANTVDVHAHHVPNWFRTLVPFTGQNPTPEWTVTEQFMHMANESIKRSILSLPTANVFPGDRNATVALARLVNENSAAIVRAFPDRFSFFATIPLPYVNESLIEVNYALESLGALGIALCSNHEGKYLGHPDFTPFFAAMHTISTIIFVHPTDPTMELNMLLVEANPTLYPAGIVEFFFETARTFMDLVLTKTLQNFTNLNYIIPHVGGSFPSIIDRSTRLGPDDTAMALDVLRTRCWWDSAGPTYAHQLGGLLAYNISPSFLLFGSDFPFIPSNLGQLAFETIATSPFLDNNEKQAMRSENVKRLFSGRMQF